MLSVLMNHSRRPVLGFTAKPLFANYFANYFKFTGELSIQKRHPKGKDIPVIARTCSYSVQILENTDQKEL